MTNLALTVIRAVAVALAFVACATSANAQTYPNKRIVIISPYPLGGSADLLIRPISQKLAEALGQPVVLDNKPGAGGTIAMTAAARSAPDGYTLVFSNVGPVAVSPALQTLQYDSVRDFQPITQLVSGALVLVVRPGVPVASVQELIAYAKANPGKLSYGSIGAGSTTHLAGEMLNLMAGINLVHVPYKGAAPVVTDLLGGQIDLAFLGIPGTMPFIQQEKLRAIAVSTLKRTSVLAAVPAIAETLPGFEVNSWYNLMLPAGTPKPIVDRLYAEISRILKMPEMMEQMKNAGLDIEGTTPEQHAAKIKEDIARWAKLVKAIGVTTN